MLTHSVYYYDRYADPTHWGGVCVIPDDARLPVFLNKLGCVFGAVPAVGGNSMKH